MTVAYREETLDEKIARERRALSGYRRGSHFWHVARRNLELYEALKADEAKQTSQAVPPAACNSSPGGGCEEPGTSLTAGQAARGLAEHGIAPSIQLSPERAHLKSAEVAEANVNARKPNDVTAGRDPHLFTSEG